jgi:hypothetical protein
MKIEDCVHWRRPLESSHDAHVAADFDPPFALVPVYNLVTTTHLAMKATATVFFCVV